MVKRLVNFINKEVSGLHEAAYLLGTFAVLSQLLALIRDRILAHQFGASASLDLYYAAFRVPDFLFATVASLFSASIIIPFLAEQLKRGKNYGKDFISSIFTVFVFVMIIISVLAFILIPYFIHKLFPGFTSQAEIEKLILLSRILLLSPILLGLSNLIGSITQLHNRFLIYAISPLFYNVGIIIGAIFLVPIFGIKGLVFGVVLGTALHLIVQVPFVLSRGLLPSFVRISKRLSLVKDVILVSIPRTLSLSANELSEFFLVAFASSMGVGSISVFNFAWNLQSVPLVIIGVSYSLAAFPTLTKYYKEGSIQKFVDYVVISARHIIFLSVPLIVLFIVLRAQIVRVILGSGAFSWADTRLTAAALSLFVISLVSQGIILLFTRAQYAAGNTKIPFKINIFSAVVTIISALVLSKIFITFSIIQFFIESLFRVSNVTGSLVLTLPLAFSIGSTIGAYIHIRTFNREYGGQSMSRINQVLFETIAVSLVMGISTYLALNIFDKIFDIYTFIGIFLQGFCAGVVGLTVGFVLFRLLDSRELAELFVAASNKFWKTPVIGPDPEESL